MADASKEFIKFFKRADTKFFGSLDPHSTKPNTLSQKTCKVPATSFHNIRFTHLARNHPQTCAKGRLPNAQGIICFYTADRTVTSPEGIHRENLDSPQGHKLKASRRLKSHCPVLFLQHLGRSKRRLFCLTTATSRTGESSLTAQWSCL
jgi:hypothetical protein